MSLPDATLKDVLRELLGIRGVTGVAVAGGDGTLFDGLALGEDALKALQELVPTALASSRALGGLLGEAAVQQALVEYEGGPVLLAPIDGRAEEDHEHVAVIGLADVADLGRVRFQLKRRLTALARALEQSETP